MPRIKLSENFYLDEFWCPCAACRAANSQISVVPSLLLMLQRGRDALGQPIEVTCGIRCTEHNKSCRGAPDSRHLPIHADAADLRCVDSGLRFRMAELFIDLGATTLIVYPRHLHVDVRPGPRKLLLGKYC